MYFRDYVFFDKSPHILKDSLDFVFMGFGFGAFNQLTKGPGTHKQRPQKILETLKFVKKQGLFR